MCSLMEKQRTSCYRRVVAPRTKDDRKIPPRRIWVSRRNPETPSVEVVLGLRFPEDGVTVHDPDHPSGLAVEVDVAPVGPRLQVVEVRAKSNHAASPVTLAALRTLALSFYIKAALSEAHILPYIRMVGPDGEERTFASKGGQAFWGHLDPAERERLRALGPGSQELLLWVGLVYRIARAIDEPPAKTVQEVFEVSPRTATNWVASARASNLLLDDGE